MDDEESSVELILDNEEYHENSASSEFKEETNNESSAENEKDENHNDDDMIEPYEIEEELSEQEVELETLENKNEPDLPLNQSNEDCEEINHDPMNLLEMLDTRFPDHSNTDSESTLNTEREDAKWNKLIEKYTWVFRDKNPTLVYCVYCNSSLKLNGSNLLRHFKSLTHVERTKEYRDYIKTLDEDVEVIISNCAAEYDITDVKQNRQNFDNDFCNFLFDRWGKTHEWLNCASAEGFNGYCKYCCINITVVNSYHRLQHETSGKHKECSKQASMNQKTLSSDSLSADNENSDLEKQEGKSQCEQTPNKTDLNVDNWYEKSKSSANLCRCKLCDITMFIHSYTKHKLSNLHQQNITALDTPGNSHKFEKLNWSELSAKHPWLIEDPLDPMEAFCKFCKKRILHGSSAAKRMIHEHGAPHRAAVDNYHKTENCDDENKNEVEEDGSEVEKESEKKVNQEALSEYTEQRGLKRKRTNEEMEASHSWLVVVRGDPTNVYCKICRLKFLRSNRRRHEETQRHKDSEKIWLSTNSKSGNQKPNLGTSGECKIMKQRIAEWQKRYSWLRYQPGLTMNYAYCIYCKRAVFVPSTRLVIKHQRSLKHLRPKREFKKQIEHETNVNTEKKFPGDTKEDDSSKKQKPCSLKRGIETAKMLTESHLRMLHFMRTSGRETTKNIIIKKIYTETKEQLMLNPKNRDDEKQLSTNLKSHTNESTASVGHQSRDPFDLFFESMGETVKRLPPDLASEGRLKVMQVVFDLEMRSQQRQNLNTTNTSNSSHNITPINNQLLNEESSTLTPPLISALESSSSPEVQKSPMPKIEQHSIREIKLTNYTPNQQKQSSGVSESIGRSHNQHDGQKYFVLASMKSMQRPPQNHFTYSPKNSNNVSTPTQSSSISVQYQQQQQTSTPQQRKSKQLTQQHKSTPHQRISTLQQPSQGNSKSQELQSSGSNDGNGSILRQKLCSYAIQNNNQRLNINNTPLTFAGVKRVLNGNGNTTTNVSSNDILSNAINNNAPANKTPKIRPVPLSSLIVKNTSNTEHNQQVHHIQLNPSAPSRVIPNESKDPLCNN